MIEKHRLAQEADRSLAGPEWVRSDLLFTSQLGHVIHPDTFTWLMHKLITAHNEPKTLARRRVADIFAKAVERSVKRGAVSKSVSKTGPEDDKTRRSTL